MLSRTAWRWFGPGVAVRFLLLLRLSLTRRRALAVIYDRLGCVSFRRPFRGKKLRWARVDFGFIREIFEQQSYTAQPEMDVEGAEREIFSEAPWLGRVRRIALEVHGERGDAQGLRGRLRSAGFRVLASPAGVPDSLVHAVRESGGGLPDESVGIG